MVTSECDLHYFYLVFGCFSPDHQYFHETKVINEKTESINLFLHKTEEKKAFMHRMTENIDVEGELHHDFHIFTI